MGQGALRSAGGAVFLVVPRPRRRSARSSCLEARTLVRLQPPTDRRRRRVGIAVRDHPSSRQRPTIGRAGVGKSHGHGALPFQVGGGTAECNGAKLPVDKPSVAVLRAGRRCNPDQRTDEMTGSEGENEPQQVAPCQGHGDQDTGEQKDGFHGRAPPGYLREGEPAGLPASTTRQLSIPQTRPESARENRSVIEDRRWQAGKDRRGGLSALGLGEGPGR